MKASRFEQLKLMTI